MAVTRILLLILTIGSVFILSWMFSVWSESGRVCISDHSIAGFEFIRDNGQKEALPVCGPLSYLFQPEFDAKERKTALRALREISKVKLLTSRLGIPLKNRFHVQMGEQDSQLFLSRIMSFVVSEANGSEFERFGLAGSFYGLYIQDQFFRNSPGWLESYYRRALLSGDERRKNAVNLMIQFKKMHTRRRLPFLKDLWRDDEHFASKIPSEAVKHLKHFHAVVRVEAEDQFMKDYFLAEVSEGLSEFSKPVVVEAGNVVALFPEDLEYVSASVEYATDHFVVLQCEPPAPDLRLELGYKDVYFIEYCGGEGAEKVSEVAKRVVDYLQSNPLKPKRIQSRKVSLRQNQ